jgi:hypothetical protein
MSTGELHERVCAPYAVSAGRPGGGKVEGNQTLEPDLTGRPTTALLLVRAYVAGTGFEPV